jgi:hypothetical protein
VAARSRQEFAAEKGGRRGRKSVLPEQVARLLGKGLSVQEVAQALGKPSRTIRYHAAKLRGIVADEFLPASVPVEKNGNISASIYYRVHAWRLSFPLRFVSDAFRRRLKKGNVATVRSHRVELYKSRVVIVAARGTEFSARSQQEAFGAGLEYFENLVRVLEHRWKVSLWKRDGQFSVACHTAEVGNELARNLGERKEWVRIVDPVDGKAWALVDASTGVPEFEAVDAVNSRDDMARVLAPFFNDLRAHAGSLPVPSEQYRAVGELREDVRALVASVRALVELERSRAGVSSEPVVSSGRVGDERPWYIQ